LIGRPLSTAPLWDEPQRQLLAEAVTAGAAGQPSRHELTVSGSRGAQAVYQLSLSPLRAADGGADRVIVEIVDVSDLVRTRTMLAQARRLEALGKLSGGVAHDINNMLAAIQGSCDLLRAHGGADARRVETSREIIQASVTRASALTKQLLAFGRQDRFESVDIDITGLVNDMGALFERTLTKNIVIQLVPSDAPLFIRGDRAALENALLNLALNAQDAMPVGGTLTLRTRAAIDVPAGFEPGPAVLIRVSDTGTGMSESVRERMFEPFFTTKAMGKGTGLGLAAVHGTVRNHRGEIVVHSQEGIGTTFDLYFPARNAGRVRTPVAEARPELQHLSARVLMADDEPLVRDALIALLELAGCEVRAVESGEALIEALMAGASPDVIVSDLAMPGLSGKSLVQMLEKTCPGCPLLLITGFTGDDVSAALTGRSHHRLLRKPVSQADLLRALHELLPEASTVPVLRAKLA
jgi:signal transduction histidine kinase/ActR/RegA family two-component response regulator